MRAQSVADKENKPKVRSVCKLNVVNLSFLAINRMKERIGYIVSSKMNKNRQHYSPNAQLFQL